MPKYMAKNTAETMAKSITKNTAESMAKNAANCQSFCRAN
jgi:hypothetical protein